jgi:DNA-binding NtrC family response regulator
MLGRGTECDVQIDSPSVSRRHAILHLGRGLHIEDLGSANGTFVRDPRAPTESAATMPLRKLSNERFEIAIGDRVNLGAISIVVRRTASGPSAEGATAERSAVVRDPAMLELYEQIGRAARSIISVLILGETGVGKEVLARAVHERSPRARGPFLELNCATLPPSLIESELFGYEKNAFTGANQARPGLLESADQGTVFLDEIGELPLPVQIKLLRVLEDRKVVRVGARTPRQLDVRFVAATNRDLELEIARGNFRQDLYFRINGLSVVIPPLRARVAEIAPLAERFLADASLTLDRVAPLQLSSEALGYLERYAWPGNVRELRNAMERAAVLASGDLITPADLPTHVTCAAVPATGAARPAPPAPQPTRETTPPRPVASATAEPSPPPLPEPTAERQQIIAALEQCAGNQTRAAKLLGISLRTLVSRLAEYDIPRPRRKP